LQRFPSFPETDNTWVVSGTDGPQVAFGGANLRDWNQRLRSANEVQQEIQKKARNIEGVSTFAFQLPSLPGSTGGLPVQMAIQSSQNYHSVHLAMEKIKKSARDSGLFSVVDSDLDFNSPLVNVHVNRSKANDLGISMQEIGESLAVLVGENFVNRFALDGRSYDVIPQLPRSERMSGDVLVGQYLRLASRSPDTALSIW
jgi:multidrug efflux pump